MEKIYTINTEIDLQNIDDYVQFKNDNNNLSISNSSDYAKFIMTGSNIEASGNIMSMLNYSTSCTDFCFLALFQGCTSLTSIKNLQFPANTLAQSCYAAMFEKCSGLTSIPSNMLPATTLTEQCYMTMFKSCTSLQETCDLPATSPNANQCYYQMFCSCTNLKRVFTSLTSWNATNTENWLYQVSNTEIIICPTSLPDTRGTSNIPTNWLVINR